MEDFETQPDEPGTLTAWWLEKGVTPPTICNVSPITKEFMGLGLADPSPLEPGVWLMPADAFEGDAPIVFPGFAAIRVEGDAVWQQVPDHRGKTVYDKDTRAARVHEVLGELPESLTLEAPQTDFDVWQGGRWVFDTDARNAALTNQASLKKTLLGQCAAGMISTLQYAVDKGIATDEEVTLLDAWRMYAVTLNRVVAGPDVAWPSGPDQDATDAYLQSHGYEDIPT